MKMDIDKMIDDEKDVIKICKMVNENIKIVKNETLAGIVIAIFISRFRRYRSS